MANAVNNRAVFFLTPGHLVMRTLQRLRQRHKKTYQATLPRRSHTRRFLPIPPSQCETLFLELAMSRSSKYYFKGTVDERMSVIRNSLMRLTSIKCRSEKHARLPASPHRKLTQISWSRDVRYRASNSTQSG